MKCIDTTYFIDLIRINKGCEAVVTRNEEHFRWIEEITGLRVVAY